MRADAMHEEIAPDSVVDTAVDTAPDAAKRPGRPRSERAEQAIIDAALDAFAEFGIEGLRVEDVAARAGVGKATVYRRWPGKEDLLITALAAMKSPLPEPKGESARDDLVAMVDVMARDSDNPCYARQFAMLHGEGERYPKLMARYKETVVAPRREMIRSVIRRGVATGELRPDTDVEIAMLTITGAVMARGKHEAPHATAGVADSTAFATGVVDQVINGLKAAPATGS